MLNKEQIRIMTRMASYEEGEGKEYLPVKQYYRKDYVSYEMIKTFVSSTISFGILFLLYMLYSMDALIEELAKMDLVQFGISLLIKYIIFVVIYQVIACLLYNRKYTKATDSVKKYHGDLKKAIRIQERDEKLQSAEDWE